MCGIVGEIRFGTASPPGAAWQGRMLDALTHRGPDDSGTWAADGAWLGHRRLSIIDLSPRGRQPMTSVDEAVAVVFNGEIYNFNELRPWLEQRGHTFRSRTDTEVIIHLYEELGEAFLDRLNGMFAIGLWDARARKLILARDRMGVKPLVYSLDSGGLVFASEIKALLEHPGVGREIDPEGLELFFTFNYIPAPWTIYRGIRKLAPGHVAVFSREGLTLRRYWDIDPRPEPLADEEEAVLRLRQLMGEATRDRMVSDVPLGAFLSGGFDSSVVVANMAMASPNPVKTYFISYGNDPLFDESEYARAVASRYGTEHHEIELSPGDGLACLSDVLSFFDEPFADSSAIPTYLVCRATRRDVTVAMSGDGGDEIFGGYRRYLGEEFIRYYRWLPRVLRDRLLRPAAARLPDSKGSRWLEYLRRFKIFIDGAAGTPEERHCAWVSYFPERDRMAVFEEGTAGGFKGLGRQLVGDLHQRFRGDAKNRMLFTDVKNLLPGDMLNKVDWMSMKNSLEVRSPLLDYRVAELAFRMPGSFKIKGRGLKRIFKKAFRDDLPAALLGRPKQGFEVPVGEWLKRERTFQDLFWEVVSFDGVEAQGLFRMPAVRALFDEHLRNRRDNSHKLWALFVFQYWWQHGYGPGN